MPEAKRDFHLDDSMCVSDEERLAERMKYALISVRDCVEVHSGKRGGIPVLRGTRFTVAQVFAEVGDGRSLAEIAEAFGLDLDQMKKLMESFSIYLDCPVAP